MSRLIIVPASASTDTSVHDCCGRVMPDASVVAADDTLGGFAAVATEADGGVMCFVDEGARDAAVVRVAAGWAGI